MAKVEVYFEVELPFWLRMKDGKYNITIDKKNWPIYLFNDKWRVAMGNELDGTGKVEALPNNRDEALKVPQRFKDKKYYHYEKLKTVIKTGFGWEIPGNTKEEARKKVKKEFNWCKRTLLKQINRFIEIYRDTIGDQISHTLGYFDLSKNWWYSILLEGKWIEGNKIVYSPELGSPSPLIEDSAQQDIAGRLKMGFVPPLWKLLFQNAISLHQLGKYNTSYIECITSFEIFLAEFLRNKFEQKGYGNALIQTLIEKRHIGFLLDEGLEIATGKPFHEISPELWNEWTGNGKVLKRRNDIIHRGIDVSREQTKKAIEVVDQMILEIIKQESISHS